MNSRPSGQVEMIAILMIHHFEISGFFIFSLILKYFNFIIRIKSVFVRRLLHTTYTHNTYTASLLKIYDGDNELLMRPHPQQHATFNLLQTNFQIFDLLKDFLFIRKFFKFLYLTSKKSFDQSYNFSFFSTSCN